jgi:tRNA uridine 5-carboxymethylaminomethyl modification enzyme
MVKGLVVKEGRCLGVVTGMGHEILSDAVVLTNGTFLNGVVHIGEKNFGGGRMAERAASGITEQLVELGFESDRLKTGTPPRIDGRSLDYSKMEEQPGDDQVVGFSFQDVPKPAEQRSCWIAYTDPTVHDVLKTGFDRSPMFAGRIDGVGPRYCPSIEDKINRFSDRDRHQLFIEPEGWNTVEIYVNGFSTSLPEDVQYEALRRVPGFENVRMFRPGYAIEYDYFPPTQLDYSLETRHLRNLFFAGQINGTTGYEEAACQGLMAGINAHRRSKEENPLVLKRSDAYIGVLIDDLISKGTTETYRMFTSRAEYRTLLRQDNADLRLTEMSYRIGLAGQDRMDRVEKKSSAISSIKDFLNTTSIEPDEVNNWLLSLGSAPISEKQKASRIVLRPDVELNAFMEACPKLKGGLQQYDVESLEQAGIQIKYQVYLDKERELVSRMAQMEELEIPERFDYARIGSLGNEAREKLEKVRPRTLGQASRISGINPSDVQILMVYMGR